MRNIFLLFILLFVFIFPSCSSDENSSPLEITTQNVVAKWVATEMLSGNTWVAVDTTQYLPACLFLSEDGYFWTLGMIYRNGAGKYMLDGNTITTTDGKKLCRFETLTANTAQAYVSDGEGGTLQLRFQRDETARYLYIEPKKWLVGTWHIDDIQGGIVEFSDTLAKIIYGDIILNEPYGRVSSNPWLIAIGNSILIHSADLNTIPNIMYLDMRRDGKPIPCRKIQ